MPGSESCSLLFVSVLFTFTTGEKCFKNLIEIFDEITAPLVSTIMIPQTANINPYIKFMFDHFFTSISCLFIACKQFLLYHLLPKFAEIYALF